MRINSSNNRVRALALAVTFLVSACSGGDGNSAATPDPASPNTLTMVAGSEVADLAPLFDDIKNATGVTLSPTYSGTLSGIDAIESGSTAPDAAWFAQDKYFALTDTAHRIKAENKTMISPVVLGVKESKARELGWVGKPVTWKQIEAAIGAGKIRYAMTSPATSNSGFSAVISVTSALSGSGDAVASKDVNSNALTAFFSGQKLISGSSGWLGDAYVGSQDTLDGMINYESLLLALNASGKLHERLTLLYPTEGVTIADYPMVLLNEKKRDAYQKVVDYIRSPDFQNKIVSTTMRRSILPNAALPSGASNATLVDMPFPNSRATIDAMLLAYMNQHRPPAHAFFVIDTSGSMEGERLDEVKRAFHVLTGSDDTITGRFARFDDREKITILTFASKIKDEQNFEMHGRDDPQTFAQIGHFADSLDADGGTAIYTSLERVLDQAEADPDGRYDSVVLMTDGENNEGESERQFEDHYAARGKKVRVFAVFIGEANPAELNRVTAFTGGRAFDARHVPLAGIFKEIRGYQ